MTGRSAAKTPAKPVWLSNVDIRIIRTIATHHYMTAKDIAYSVYEPTSLTYVRSRAARLAGCADHIPNQYLYRFSRPHTDPGRSEKVFTVGTKGRDLLASLQGVDDMDRRFRPYKLQALRYSFLLHALLLSRFIAAGTFWSRQQSEYDLVESHLHYELAKNRRLTSITLQGKPVSVIADAFLCFERVADGSRFPLLFEADCGTESGRTFRQHVHNRLAYLQSPQYEQLAKTSAGRVCYLTIGQHPRYKETRRTAMQRFTQDVLAELDMAHWASVFLFASVDYHHLFQTPLFDQPRWYHPDSQTPVSLLPL
jgi:hypothetical protein